MFSDVLQQFSNRSFDVCKMHKAQCIGEETIDYSGPCREFFNFLIREIKSSFCWVLKPSYSSAQHGGSGKNTYYTIGKMIATCIIQGGEAPASFAKAVADLFGI